MTRTEAKAAAAAAMKAYHAADIEHLFRGAPAPVPADFGMRHGWFSAGGFSFSQDELTGEQYDFTQGGWAYA